MSRREESDRQSRVLQRMRTAYGDTFPHDPRSTIVPARATDSAKRSAADALGRVYRRLNTDAGERGADFAGAYKPGATIGVGGTGLVREAEQVALGRTVALKSLRPELSAEAATLDLLREAWIAGSLDHPNVVPVHDIVLDGDRAPVIVLKRIHGVPWSELMRDGARVREQFGANDLLEWNLGILLQVLNAIRFAHSRGVIHRDIKPDNVMIGAFGEVYVLDWGLAVSTVADESERLPLARDATEMAGTPCYMAPEMLGVEDPDDPGISERTDVYLAGANLYEILTGQPPHTGAEPMAILQRVLAANPEFSGERFADVPAELTDICRRAMAARPARRFASVDDMRLAIQRFLQHRGSLRLSRQADAALAQLLAELDGTDARTDAEESAPGADSEAGRQRLYKLYGACRFGFREALIAWPESDTARAGLQRAALAMIDHELARGHPGTADVLYADLDRDDPAARARIDAAVGAERAEQARVAALAERGREFDKSVRERERVLSAFVLIVLFTLVPVLVIWRYGTGSYDEHRELAMWNGGYLLVSLAVGWTYRAGLAQSAINRRLYAMLLVLLLGNLALELGLYQAGLSAEHSLLVHTFLWFFTTAAVAVTLEHRLAPTACAYLVGFLVYAFAADLDVYVLTVPHGVLAANVAVVWNLSRRTRRA